MNSRFICFLALFVLLGAGSCFAQDLSSRLKSIQDPHFEVVGSENLGRYRSSRSDGDTMTVIAVYVSSKYARQRTHFSEFIAKTRSAAAESRAYFVYFLDDREAARRLLQLLQSNEEKKEGDDKFIRSIKALFVSLKNENKEFLRLFENGMTEKDFDDLALELKN